MGSRFVLHGADEVSFRVVEIESAADRGDVKFRHCDFAAVGFDCPDCGVDIIHSDGALEADHSLTVYRLLPFLQQASDTRIVLIARRDQVEIGRSPRLEAPSEGLFVKSPGATHVVAMNGKAREIVGHAASIGDTGKPRLRRTDNKCRESASLLHFLHPLENRSGDAGVR